MTELYLGFAFLAVVIFVSEVLWARVLRRRHRPPSRPPLLEVIRCFKAACAHRPKEEVLKEYSARYPEYQASLISLTRGME